MHTSTLVTISAGSLLASIIGYAVYFDYQRRNNSEYRKALYNANKLHRTQQEFLQRKKAEGEKARYRQILQETKTEIASVKTSAERSEAIKNKLQYGEMYALQKKFWDSAKEFYIAMFYMPNPMELLGLLEQQIHPEVLRILQGLISENPQMFLSRVQQSFDASIAMTSLRPPHPKYVFRGHSSSVTSLTIFSDNVLSSDADGWIIVWAITSMRPRIVWKAHDNTILNADFWDQDRIISHGRDHKLFVWKINYLNANVDYPVEGRDNKKPWIIGALDVNALNYCGFSKFMLDEKMYVAIPSAKSEEIDIWMIPDNQLVHGKIKSDTPNGLVMCISLQLQNNTWRIYAGYESGAVIIFEYIQENWSIIYAEKGHQQPVLSVLPLSTIFVTSSADSFLTIHSLSHPPRAINTKRLGQESLSCRGDEKLLVSAGWDGTGRVYHCETGEMLAVLKLPHDGCKAAFWGKAGILLGGKEGRISFWDVYAE
ncbi:ASTRA-associated protein 1 [Neolecta irregularis DAH-3]|uniref:ASTRA-associated protein 1 n=1 Tax=Neolecta irregularis (strain DAH-3) TaxID=1198029 RepID=A0A1U7LHF4_NEOID|nr:ASTRA-associated protein 1 [Neolecta irregularis DAH-3]|eukprot:OLL22058.1 ASTRA-associated protein 1 [Neolecta irregularis DAH-3]